MQRVAAQQKRGFWRDMHHVLQALVRAWGASIAAVEWIRECRSRSVVSRTSLPASILEMSRMFSISDSKVRAEAWMVWALSFCSALSGVP